jgi:DNA ligase 1
MTHLPTIYKRTVTGAIQQWTIWIDEDCFYTEEGQVGGTITQSQPTVCEGKNIGRSNATTPEQQALLEAIAKRKKKLDTGYVEKLADVDNTTYLQPMLAHAYEDHAHELHYPLYTQPKLDGIRCIASEGRLTSRTGKPIVSCPHILKALRPIFLQQPDLLLDGELYTHNLSNDFNTITSIVRTSKPTQYDLLRSSEQIQYWIYDQINGDTFRKRFAELCVLFSTCGAESIVLVPTFFVSSVEELDYQYESFLKHNYEGQIVRQDAPYQHKRSKYLLKRKEWQSAEYPIRGFIEGEGNLTGHLGSFILPGFTASYKAPWSEKKRVWNNQAQYLNKLATVKYFNLTPDGIPRFPVVVAVRDYE